ncbi:hypothetical protein BH09BAC5_BH09BAC5_05050 [soil metagenome]
MKFFYFIFAFLLFSCGGAKNSGTDSVNADTTVNATSVISDWHTLTESWTASLNLKNASIMKSFYADTVNYYGDKISGEDVVKRQQAYFASNPDYHQKIVEYIGEEQTPKGNWRVRITKQVTASGKTGDYPASLIYANENGIWKIISESDDITDLRKGTPLEVHYAPESTTIEGMLEENTGFTENTNGGDPKSDNKVTYFALWPSQYLDVIANEEQSKDGKTITEKNVDRIQVTGDDKLIKPLLNHKVKVTGTIKHSNAFTKVTFELKSIEGVK